MSEMFDPKQLIGDFIKNGIVGVENTANRAIEDFRKENRDRPRRASSDPTTAIDVDSKLNIVGFPHDRPKYYMSFGFQEYRRPTQFQALESNGFTDYLYMPLPNNLIDNNSFNYSQTDGSFVIDAITDYWQDSRSSMKGKSGEEMLNSAVGALGNSQTYKNIGEVAAGFGTRSILDKLRAGSKIFGSPGFVDTALQIPGLADNPFATVAFAGPNFKRHSFTWRLSPKTEAESKTIKRIVDILKKVSHPELLSAGAGGFYKYPHICMPTFNPLKVRESMYKFKPSVITSININYSPNDRPGFYAVTSAPNEVIIEMNLLEIEIWRNGNGGSYLNGELPEVSDGDFNDIDFPAVRDLGRA